MINREGNLATKSSGASIGSIESGPSLGAYYNASQLRADTWNRLKVLVGRLEHHDGSGAALAELRAQAEQALILLGPVESYWAFPGHDAFNQLRRLFEREDYLSLSRAVNRIVRALMSNTYRRKTVPLGISGESEDEEEEEALEGKGEHVLARPYFEVLIVDQLNPHQEHSLRLGLRETRRSEDSFVYETVVVPSFEDALIGVLFNHNIQAVVVRYGFPFKSRNRLDMLHRYLSRIGDEDLSDLAPEDYGVKLAELICRLRPELDVYLVTDQLVEEIAGRVSKTCRRVFYNQEDYLELHLNILRGINQRYETPFFTALKHYSKQPTGVFHAMPISRGKSITKSHWIQDMGEFYGMNIFLAETSATSGGLDSLLEPKGPIKKAQELAARAFGARHTFFATNGTSTCNKIVVQALVRPGDIVLVDRDCHKSHHYGMVLSGAHVVYLDSYPLSQYSMYGAVPLMEIKRQLLQLKRAGKLDRVKLLLLTNCTFDGIVYNVERVMEECLAIKPDLVFLWDEAWFGFARFGPAYRQRTAMNAAEVLRRRYRSDQYRAAYGEFRSAFDALDPEDDGTWLDRALLPDPDRVRVRVYATQSTHKTLTALRQGSMIHVHDQDYKSKVEEPFHEAYMTHTSTSPNYQILASLDVGRRQVELEGFELVQKQVEMAMVLREKIATHPLISKYFRMLTVGDLVPEEYRLSGITSYYDKEHGWNDIWDAWANDEFTLDATRLTLYVGKTGIDGDTFKNDVLMSRYGIQINKTSRNSVLFMTNIGTTRSSTAYLIEVLVQIARELDERLDDSSPAERRVHEKRLRSLTENLPPLPDFSHFHGAFRPDPGGETPEGDIRAAYFLSYDDSDCEYLGLDDGALDEAMNSGREIVSSGFIIPYPPGFPILVPGQVISPDILAFMRALDVKEIHGYRPDLGLRVFTERALGARSRSTKHKRVAAE
ncbi:MAG: aminotransferase class I/II-fold pyridoxal phosphate-dependent enzyme [Kiloniellales bacterium]